MRIFQLKGDKYDNYKRVHSRDPEIECLSLFQEVKWHSEIQINFNSQLWCPKCHTALQKEKYEGDKYIFLNDRILQLPN